MDKLHGNQLSILSGLYEAYSCNRSPIFSIFEKQFTGCAYVNDINNISWAVLQTPFLQHFVAGVPTDGCETVLEKILFDHILSEQAEKELVVFSDSEKWNSILDNVFQKHQGVSDFRKFFEFSENNYRKVSRIGISSDIKIVLEKCKNLPFSYIDTWSAKLTLDGQVISYCNAIMVGKNMAEIDIFTEEAFRGKGYGVNSAILLIDKLLEEGLVPTWSAWPFRVESQHIAKKLGFIPLPDAKAWIWQEGM